MGRRTGRRNSGSHTRHDDAPTAPRSPGKRTRTSQIQRRSKPASTTKSASGRDAQEIASEGTRGSGSTLPHRETIQRSFGRHDVGNVRAHVGGDAAEASEKLGAQAFATGEDVAFQSAPDLHTAAHEAAHVVQQQQGVQLKGGVGEAGDAYERHADAVADAVVAGRSAEPILEAMPAGGSSGSAGVQRKEGDGEIAGSVVGAQLTDDGLELTLNRGTGAGVELGWSVTLADGSSYEITETTPGESKAILDRTIDEVRSLGFQVTFTPKEKTRGERRRERRATKVPVHFLREVDDHNCKVEIGRGAEHGFDMNWKVQLLNADGSPRIFGEVVSVSESTAWLQFPIHYQAVETSENLVRIIPG